MAQYAMQTHGRSSRLQKAFPTPLRCSKTGCYRRCHNKMRCRCCQRCNTPAGSRLRARRALLRQLQGAPRPTAPYFALLSPQQPLGALVDAPAHGSRGDVEQDARHPAAPQRPRPLLTHYLPQHRGLQGGSRGGAPWAGYQCISMRKNAPRRSAGACPMTPSNRQDMPRG